MLKKRKRGLVYYSLVLFSQISLLKIINMFILFIQLQSRVVR